MLAVGATESRPAKGMLVLVLDNGAMPVLCSSAI